MSNEREYLVSADDSDDEYGLYVMEVKETTTHKEMYLVYFFDNDRFTHVGNEQLKYFVAPDSLTSCIDEFGDVYTGQALKNRIKEAINAFEEELPGWKSYVASAPIDLEWGDFGFFDILLLDKID